jgi:competence protein ComGC
MLLCQSPHKIPDIVLVHDLVSTSVGHAAPPPDAGVTSVLVLVSVPFIHADQADQSDTTQSTGTVHDLVSTSVGHAAPPPDAGVISVLVLVSVPFIHADQADQSDTTQSTGNTDTTGISWWFIHSPLDCTLVIVVLSGIVNEYPASSNALSTEDATNKKVPVELLYISNGPASPPSKSIVIFTIILLF